MSSGGGTQDRQEKTYGHTATDFTNTRTPVRPERVLLWDGYILWVLLKWFESLDV